MIKYFCDLCGKEVTDKIIFRVEHSVKGDSLHFRKFDGEVCYDCYDKLVKLWNELPSKIKEENNGR